MNAAHIPSSAGPGPADALARQDLEALIESLELTALQKHFLRSRWLDQLTWTDRKAEQAQQRYYALRLVVIVGSIAMPMLVGLAEGNDLWRGLAMLTGMLVAISAAIEGFFHLGERWQHYRRTAERLKAEGWRFFQGSGPYQRFGGHGAAYGEFASAVERILEADVRVYLDEIVREPRPQDHAPAPGPPRQPRLPVPGSA